MEPSEDRHWSPPSSSMSENITLEDIARYLERHDKQVEEVKASMRNGPVVFSEWMHRH